MTDFVDLNDKRVEERIFQLYCANIPRTKEIADAYMGSSYGGRIESLLFREALKQYHIFISEKQRILDENNDNY